MKRTAIAVAHPNIALSKYWGKREGEGNVPAVPSLSVTLEGLATRTSVTFDDDLPADTFALNDSPADATRVTALLDRVRALAGTTARADVVSKNDFPTASGLASSASGFAALALAAVRAAGLDLPADRVADLARKSSASAARSLFGGFVELEGERTRVVAPKTTFDLRILVCVTTEKAKAVSSTEAMNVTARDSAFYASWIEAAPRIHSHLLEGFAEENFDKVGRAMEKSTFAMHASAMAAGIVFVTDATLAAYAEVVKLRSELPAWATFDAGPHLKCFVKARDVARARARLENVPGVLRIIEARPGDGARVEVAP